MKNRISQARKDIADPPFRTFYDSYMTEDGVLDLKTKEMIAIAFAYGTKCHSCIKIHKAKAFELGMSEEEYRELVAVCEVIAGGGVLMDYRDTSA